MLSLCFLVRQDRGLSVLSSRQEPWICFLIWMGWQKRLKARKTYWLGTQIRQNGSLARGTTILALQMGKATFSDIYSGTAARRNTVCQDPSAICCKPSSRSPSHSDLKWLRPTDSPHHTHTHTQYLWDKTQASLPGSNPQLWKSWISTLGSLSPTRETVALGIPLRIALFQPGRGAVQSEHSWWSYPSHVVLLDLCGSERWVSLTTIFWDFYNGVLSVVTCKMVFLWGGLQSGTNYVTILMTSLYLYFNINVIL